MPQQQGLDEDLALITEAARAAGEIAMGFFRRDPKVWWKEGDSPVSEADLAVDRHLRRFLTEARPHYGWLSEETDPRSAAEADGSAPQRFFVVDPIDGTRSYLRGEETWCVSIAVVDGARPVVGVLDVPAREEVFTAVAGGTALLNGEAIAVRDASVDGVLHVAVPDPFRRRLTPADAGRFAFAAPAPSLAYRLAEVACGRLDGTIIRRNANDWDVAAGDLILQRAGGALVDASTEECLYKIEGRRHGVLVAAARHALESLNGLAQTLASA